MDRPDGHIDQSGGRNFSATAYSKISDKPPPPPGKSSLSTLGSIGSGMVSSLAKLGQSKRHSSESDLPQPGSPAGYPADNTQSQ